MHVWLFSNFDNEFQVGKRGIYAWTPLISIPHLSLDRIYYFPHFPSLLYLIPLSNDGSFSWQYHRLDSTATSHILPPRRWSLCYSERFWAFSTDRISFWPFCHVRPYTRRRIPFSVSTDTFSRAIHLFSKKNLTLHLPVRREKELRNTP